MAVKEAAPTKKQLERRLGRARFEVQAVLRHAQELEQQAEALGKQARALGVLKRVAQPNAKSDAKQVEFATTLEDVKDVLDALLLEVGRLRDAVDVPVGMSVEQAAESLSVSAPTVRRWLREDLLEQVEGRKPAEIEQESVAHVAAILERVRVSFPEREWTRALAAYLHDRDLRRQGWASEGIAAFEAGRLVRR